MAPKGPQKQKHLGMPSYVGKLSIAIRKLCEEINNGRTALEAIDESNPLSDVKEGINSYRKNEKEIPDELVKRLVEAIDNNGSILCRRLEPAILSTVVEMLLQGAFSRSAERGLFLVAESLFNDSLEEEDRNLSAERKEKIGHELLFLLLSYLLDIGNEFSMRRWVGVLCIQLLHKSEANVGHLGMGSDDIRQGIGSGMIYEKNEIIRVLLGQLIKNLQDSGVPIEALFPEDANEAFLRQFPVSSQQEEGWGSLFERYVEKVVPNDYLGEDIIMFGTWLSLTPFQRFGKPERNAYMLVSDEHFFLMAQESPTNMNQFLDIPLTAISQLEIIGNSENTAVSFAIEIDGAKEFNCYLDTAPTKVLRFECTALRETANDLILEFDRLRPGLKVIEVETDSLFFNKSLIEGENEYQTSKNSSVSQQEILINREGGESPQSQLTGGAEPAADVLADAHLSISEDVIGILTDVEADVNGPQSSHFIVPSSEPNQNQPLGEDEREAGQEHKGDRSTLLSSRPHSEDSLGKESETEFDNLSPSERRHQPAADIKAEFDAKRAFRNSEPALTKAISKFKLPAKQLAVKPKAKQPIMMSATSTSKSLLPNQVENRSTAKPNITKQDMQSTGVNIKPKIILHPKKKRKASQEASQLEEPQNGEPAFEQETGPGDEQVSTDLEPKIDHADPQATKLVVKAKDKSQDPKNPSVEKLSKGSFVLETKNRQRYNLSSPGIFDIPDEDEEPLSKPMTSQRFKYRKPSGNLSVKQVTTKVVGKKKRQSAPAKFQSSLPTRHSQRRAAAKANAKMLGAEAPSDEEDDVEPGTREVLATIPEKSSQPPSAGNNQANYGERKKSHIKEGTRFSQRKTKRKPQPRASRKLPAQQTKPKSTVTVDTTEQRVSRKEQGKRDLREAAERDVNASEAIKEASEEQEDREEDVITLGFSDEMTNVADNNDGEGFYIHQGTAISKLALRTTNLSSALDLDNHESQDQGSDNAVLVKNNVEPTVDEGVDMRAYFDQFIKKSANPELESGTTAMNPGKTSHSITSTKNQKATSRHGGIVQEPRSPTERKRKPLEDDQKRANKGRSFESLEDEQDAVQAGDGSPTAAETKITIEVTGTQHIPVVAVHLQKDAITNVAGLSNISVTSSMSPPPSTNSEFTKKLESTLLNDHLIRKQKIISFDIDGPQNQGILGTQKLAAKGQYLVPLVSEKSVDDPETSVMIAKRKRSEEDLKFETTEDIPPQKKQSISPEVADKKLEDHYKLIYVQDNTLVPYENSHADQEKLEVFASSGPALSNGHSRSQRPSSQASRVDFNGSPLASPDKPFISYFGQLAGNLSSETCTAGLRYSREDAEHLVEGTKPLSNIFKPRITLGIQPKAKPSAPLISENRFVAHQKIKNGHYQVIGTNELVEEQRELADPFSEKAKKTTSFNERIHSSNVESQILDGLQITKVHAAKESDSIVEASANLKSNQYSKSWFQENENFDTEATELIERPRQRPSRHVLLAAPFHHRTNSKTPKSESRLRRQVKVSQSQGQMIANESEYAPKVQRFDANPECKLFTKSFRRINLEGDQTMGNSRGREVQMKSRPSDSSSGLTAGSSHASNSPPERDRDEWKAWNVAIRPHYARISDVAHRIADEMIIQLSSEEDRMSPLAEDYREKGERVMQNFDKNREKETSHIHKQLDMKSAKIAKLYKEADRFVSDKLDESMANSMAEFERGWRQQQTWILSSISKWIED